MWLWECFVSSSTIGAPVQALNVKKRLAAPAFGHPASSRLSILGVETGFVNSYVFILNVAQSQIIRVDQDEEL